MQITLSSSTQFDMFKWVDFYHQDTSKVTLDYIIQLIVDFYHHDPIKDIRVRLTENDSYSYVIIDRMLTACSFCPRDYIRYELVKLYASMGHLC